MLTRFLSIIRWLADRFKDLFYATGNQNLELSRVVTGFFAGIIAFAVYWNSVHLGKEIDLSALLTGLAAFIGAAGLGIAAKDWVRKQVGKAITQVAGDLKADNIENVEMK